MSNQFVEIAGDDGRMQRVPIVNTGPMKNGDDSRDVSRLARSAQGRRASAMATADLVASLGSTGTPMMRENAIRVLGEIELPQEAMVSETQMYVPVSAEQPAPPVEAVVEPEPVPVPTDYTLPDDLAELLDEPDELEEPEPVAEAEPYVDPDEYVDPEVAALRKQLADANKKAEHERKLRVQTARKDWEAEAIRVFALGDVPLLDQAELGGIKAESRKDFLRQAKAKADSNKLVFQRFNPAAIQTVEEPQDIDALVEARARALEAERWGNPAGGGAPSASADSVAQQQRLASARRRGNLADIIKARIYPE